jgi:hypothetical protein
MTTYRWQSKARAAMKTARTLLTLVLTSPFLFLVTSVFGQEAARVYPATPGEPVSKLFKVAVDGQSSPAYLAKVGTPANFTNDQETIAQAAFTSFDIQGGAEVEILYAKPVASAKVLPSASGIVPEISGNKVSFAVSQPGQLTVEINGDWKNSLHLFVNSFETNVPSPSDPNVIYFAPGIYHLNNIVVHTGQTVYLAPGAVLYANPTISGPLFTLNGSNITLRGRGIIDGSAVPHGLGNLIYIYHKSNIQVEGVTLRDSSSWTFHLFNSQNVQVSNIKVFGWRLNSDGIDIDSSQNVTLGNSFFRTYDDQVVIKTNNTSGIATSNILVTQCVIWNQIAHALTLGSELLALAQNVTFNNIDIIHDKGRMALLAVYNGDTGLVQNVNWSDIRVEEVQRLVSVSILDLGVSQTAERGHVANISFTDITAPPPLRSGPNVDVEGYDSTHSVNGVLFNGVSIGGALLRPGDVNQNQYVSAVTVTP